MRKTNAIEKGLTSLINATIVLVISLPFLRYASFETWKLATISIFFLYNLIFLVFNKNRCLGMIILKTQWETRASLPKELLYIFLYSLSFTTLFIWIWFPFDVFLANMLFLQLPTILLTGTTLHGYLSGNQCTVKKL